MFKILLLVPIFFLNINCMAQETSIDVFDGKAEYLGEVYTDRDNWIFCDETPDQEGCNGHPSPVVCMTYNNDCLNPIVCNLKVSALLAEPFTGFVKQVTDVREEIVFFNQTHRVCFNFAKDVYDAWFLLDTSEPEIKCTDYVAKPI